MITLCLAVAVASGLGAYGLILRLRPLLVRHALARPNARSSHRVPTPQGGGIAVVAAGLTAAAAGLGAAGLAGPRFAVLAVAILALAATGLVDDIRPLSARLRLAIQACTATALVGFVLPGNVLPLPPWLGAALLGIAIVWWVNLSNFMDGIDWITVAQFVPMSAALCLFGLAGHAPSAVAIGAAALAGGLLGFAPFNRPVARLFLGDVGSLPVGLAAGWMLAELAAAGHIAAALLLPLYYAADATLTLGRRALARERVWEAHRDHFYQRAVTGGLRTIEVVRHVFGLNVCLAALAGLTLARPGPAAASAALAAGSLLVGLTLRRFAAARG